MAWPADQDRQSRDWAAADGTAALAETGTGMALDLIRLGITPG